MERVEMPSVKPTPAEQFRFILNQVLYQIFMIHVINCFPDFNILFSISCVWARHSMILFITSDT